MNEALMLVVEEFAAFVTLSDPRDLSDEHAKWGRQRLIRILAELTESERDELVAFLKRQAEGASGQYREFLKALPAELKLERTD
jgi:hypothetical protein